MQKYTECNFVVVRAVAAGWLDTLLLYTLADIHEGSALSTLSQKLPQPLVNQSPQVNLNATCILYSSKIWPWEGEDLQIRLTTVME